MPRRNYTNTRKRPKPPGASSLAYLASRPTTRTAPAKTCDACGGALRPDSPHRLHASCWRRQQGVA